MKKLVTYLGRMISYAFLFLVCTYSNAATYYFSSTYGDDARSSAQAQNQNSPWKSIQKLNSVFNSLQPGDNIMFRNGDTFHGTLIINKSGTSGAPISFGNYGSGENPVLTGFREIKDWVSLGGNVYETYIPEVSSSVSTVVMNDVLQAMGRYPNDNASNSGYLTINSYSGGSIGSSGLQAPSSMTGGEIVIRKNNWIIDRHVINWHSGSSVNYNTAGSAYSPTIGYGFFIQNHPATLDKHGEWYFNKATKKLMIYFQGNPSGANIKVSTIDRIINTQNSASHIKLNNLTIQGSNENLINIDKSTFFTVENCLLEYVGKNAINTIMSRNLTVSNSYISNALNGGINLGWDDRATVVRSSTFSKIHAIAGMGQSADSQGNGIFMSETTSDVLIEYNEFLENGSNAIYFNGNNINIKNNLIDTFCFVKDDGGGIYTFTGPANTTFTNRKITNNIIVNGIGAVDGTKPYGATDFPYVEGIYLDLFANGIDIDQNTIGNVMSKGIFVNNARNVSITNNKIFNAGYSIFITSDYTNNLTRNITLTNNEFLNKDSNQLHVFVRSKVNTLGQMGTFDKNIYSRPINESNSFSLQVPEKNGLIDLQSWKSSYGLDANSTKSPASYESKKMGIDEFIMFEFNNSKSSKTIPLSGTYVDLKGKILSGSVVVPAYSSILLLKTEASTTPENTAPTVSITAPSTDSQFVQGDNISITSVATDTDGTISKVEFYNGTTLLGTDTSAPYSFDWTNLPIGNFSITAKATDNKGMATISDLVKINVHEKANVAPLVSITAPSTNSQFIQGDNLTITSNASNADGTLTKVEFYHENTLLGTDISAPYSFDWINLPIGSFSITAKATDNKGNSTVSEVVNIKINEKVSRSPFGGKAATIPGTVEAENYDLGGQGVGYFDFDTGNTGKAYRTDDVDIEVAVEGGYNVGWMKLNEWLEYTINITTAGAYNLDARVASPEAGGTFHIECNGIDVTGPINIPATGGWGSWSSVNKTGINLPAGTHILRYVIDNYGDNEYFGNLNSMHFSLPNEAPKVTITAPSTNSQFIQGDNLSITANATDSDGTIAKVDFYNGTSLLGTDTSAPYSFDWTNLPIGNFSITAKATDNTGTATVSAPKVINVTEKANEAPKVTITAPGTNSQFVQGDNISITSVATDTDGTIAKVDFYNGTTLLGTDTSAPYSFDWTNLPIGSFSITAKAIDNKGTATVSAPIVINVTEKANEAPKVTITAPSTSSQFIQGDNISITSVATDTDGTISKVEFYNGTTLLGTDTSAPYSFDWTNLSIGNFSITAKATDNKGTATVSAPIVINVIEKANEAPKVTITAPSTNSQFIQGDNISITSVATDTDGTISKVEFYNGTTLLGTDTSAPYSFDWTNLPIGNFSITAKATDNKGAATVSAPIVIYVIEKANEAPKVTITAPGTSSQFIQGDNISITSVATDTDGTIAKVDFYNETSLLGTDTSAPYSFDWTNLPIGNFSITAKATDNKGAATVSAPVVINVIEKANDAPKVAITAPSTNSQFIQGDQLSITANATDSDGTIVKVDFYNGTSLLGTDTSAPYSFDWINLPIGNFSITAKATDNKGTAAVSSPVVINVTEKANEAPKVTITAPSTNSQFTQGDNISITSVATDTDGTIAKVDFYNGTSLLGTDTTAPYSFDWTNLPIGSFSITAKATDNKGNSTVSEVVNIKINEKVSRSPFGGKAATIPGTVEAENYDLGGQGVGYFDFDTGNTGKAYRTDDVDIEVAVEGGYNVGWMKLNEWLEYTINITTAGAYNLDARVASPEAGGTFHIECNGIDVTGPINIPATGGWGSWTSVNKTGINLPAGTHILRYVIDNYGENEYFGNLNSMHFSLPNEAPKVTITAPSTNSQFIQGNNISITSVATDTDGTIAKVDFYNGTSLLGTDTTAPYSFDWNNLPIGNFSITAKATDNKGAATVSSPVVISVTEKANEAPKVTITAPGTNSQFVQGDNISITSVATDTDGTIAKVDFYNGTTLLGTDTSAPYSFDWTNLPIGSFSITAKAIDNKGTATVSAPIVINVTEKANEAPKVTITAPSTSSQFIQGDNISITTVATDTDGTISKVEFYNGTTLLGTDTSAPYSFDWTNLSIGNFSITAKATDNKGAATVSSPVVINVIEKANEAPKVTITAPSTNSQFTQGDNISITSVATDTDGTIAKVDFYNGTSLLGTDSSAPYSFDWTNLPIGNFSITAKATDNKGAATVSAPIVINVIEKANEAPKVTITAPSTNSQFIQGNHLSITVNATDSDGTITKVDFYNGTSLLGTDISAPYSFDWTNLPIGNFSITAKATDNKGAATMSSPVVISVTEKANEAPKVTITAPSTSSQFIQGDNISITIVATDTDGTIAKVDFYNGTSLLGTDTTAPYSFDWTNLPIGNFSITAKATDNKGAATVSSPIVINVTEKANEAPKVTITAPSTNSQFTQGDNISITSVATDTDGTIAKVDFYNGTSLLGTDNTAPYSFDWTNLPIGNFSITAKATDNKGASTVSSPVVISVIVKEELPTENPNEVLIPEIFLVTPVNNQEFDKGQSIELIVMFQGSDKFVKNVEYYSGDQLIGFSNVSPFSFKWQTPTSTKHNITAKAIGEDTSNFKISESVSILVKEKIEKIFEIIDPIKDAEFNAGESILIQVQIPENVNPINRVEYYRERISIGSSTSPYSDFKWKNAPWGNHNLSAKLVFADGTEILSETVPIKVLKRNQASVKLLSSSNQKEITSGENLDLNVELNEFEAKVEFVEYFLNGEKLGSSVIQPYSYEWKNIPDGEHQLVARAVDIKGSSIYSAPMILSARKDINTLQLEYVIGPNPTTDVLNVIFTNLDGFYDFEFKVISMNGIVKRSFKAKPEESTVTINVSNLINGVYILQVYGNGNNISSKKFIIKK